MSTIVESFTPEALARVTSGTLARAGDAARIGAVQTDSRALVPGGTFAAIVGERFDGHDFALAAAEQGAVGLIIQRDHADELLARLPEAGSPFVVAVDDTVRALGELAAAVVERRRAMDAPFLVVSITGSNGKTGTKEICRGLLSVGRRVLATRGNFNNFIGMPLSLFALEAEHEGCVLEMGANAPGEIGRLCELTRPDVRLLTTVAPAHIEGFGSIEGVARAKGEMFTSPGGERFAMPLVIRERFYRELASDPRLKTVGGPGSGAEVEVLGVEIAPEAGGIIARYRTETLGEIALELPMLGAHNAWNLGVVLAALDGHEGLGSPDAIQRGLDAVEAPPGRLEAIPQPGGWVALNDAYNANPGSMRAAFEALAALAPEEHRVMVLGEMRELGEDAEAMHRSVGGAAGACGARLILCLGGALAEAMAEGAREAAPEIDVRRLDGTAWGEARAALDATCGEGDRVLLKGSRGARLERVLGED